MGLGPPRLISHAVVVRVLDRRQDRVGPAEVDQAEERRRIRPDAEVDHLGPVVDRLLISLYSIGSATDPSFLRIEFD
jgi:hypothetical protein